MRIAPTLYIARTLYIAMTTLVLSATALTAAGFVTVSQKGRSFSAASLSVPLGQVLHVNNEDRFVHQIYVESPSFNFESDEQEPGTSVDIQLTKAGLFEVHCHIHPKMLLSLDVR